MSLATQKTIVPKSDNLEFIAGYMEQFEDELLLAGQKLSFKLQQTLHLESVINIFCSEACALVPCASVAFRKDDLGLFLYHGDKEQFQCHYDLEIEGDSLGTIECSSERAFTEQELIRLEHLLSMLIFPIRNALLYHHAVNKAVLDPLTELNNRSSFNQTIESEISRAVRQESRLSMMIVDVDHFKKVNDQYGHLAGDEVLKEVAKRLKDSLRCEDMVFRYGGEEFVVVLGATALPSARLIAERVRMALESQPVKVMDLSLDITASIGVSEWQLDECANTLFHRADQALYEAKNAGRNLVKSA